MKTLMNILKNGVTAAHVIEEVKAQLMENHFSELKLKEQWSLEENRKYYVNLYGTNIIAFTVGDNVSAPAFRIAMAHSDYPNFQLKPNAVMKGNGCTKLNVEIYGGMYQKSWIDRPLGIAGKVIVKGEQRLETKTLLYRSEQPLCIIPSLAIHMDRELNRKGALDVGKELVPIMALSENADLLAQISKQLGITESEILDYDLFLYNADKPVTVGVDASIISSPRLDNLSSVAAITEGLIQEKCGENQVNVISIFDNEEVGSLSKQGADSELLPMVIQKIGQAFCSDYKLTDSIQDSFLLSVDVAHGHHPNYEEKSDATNKAKLGAGFCIKRSVGQKYGTTSESAAFLKLLCEEYNIPYTIAVNKTGIPGGSTLGPIVTSHLPMPCADIGMPILAMHSANEMGAVKDYEALVKLIKAFYSK